MKKRALPSPTLMIACVGLFVALGGTGYAAIHRQPLVRFVGAGTSALKRGARGARGPAGLQGLQGVPGPQGSPGPRGEQGIPGSGAASCPANTTLVHGICFDSSPNPVASTLKEASDACAAKNGYLPSPMELYSARSVLDLGTGVGNDHQYTDEIYANTAGTNYSTVVVDGTGAITEQSITTPSKFTCAYSLGS
jgi:hypothetical protein